MSAPVVVTIYVRHGKNSKGKPCPYSGDEFAKRCQCRKHFRWTVNGTRQRRKAGTRSWTEAEQLKRELEDQLSGRATPEASPDQHFISDAVDVFIQDKKVQGVTAGVIKKYTLELKRLRQYCGDRGVLTVQGLTRELLTGFCGTWEALYPSSITRSKVRERVRSFLRYCYEAQWLPRIPALPKINVDEPPTMPLTDEEYKQLLDALFVANPRRWDGKASTQGITADRRAWLHALIQLMRWSGLSIQDAVTLERVEIRHDDATGMNCIVTSRQKTGTDVSVPIPPAVAKEILAVANGNSRYVFWTGNGLGASLSRTVTTRYLRPLFEAAKIPCDGHMVAHRLRDTFAVDLLQKGIPLEEVSKLLGHESIKTTEKSYAKWVKGRQDRLNALVTATWTA